MPGELRRYLQVFINIATRLWTVKLGTKINSSDFFPGFKYIHLRFLWVYRWFYKYYHANHDGSRIYGDNDFALYFRPPRQCWANRTTVWNDGRFGRYFENAAFLENDARYDLPGIWVVLHFRRLSKFRISWNHKRQMDWPHYPWYDFILIPSSHLII